LFGLILKRPEITLEADPMATEDASLHEALDHYRILSEVISDYAFKTRLDPGGTPVLEWISDSWERDFGYRPSGPDDVFEHVHPEDRRHVTDQWAELRAGRAIEGELRLLPRSGGELWVHYRAKPIVSAETGEVVGTYGAMQDIHDRKMAEELWRQAEARFRAQFQSSPIPTFTWQRAGDDFVLIDFNRAAEEMTKGGIARFLGRAARQVTSDPDFLDDVTQVFESGTTIKREFDYTLRTTGEQKQLLVTIARVPPNIVLVHTVDITELKKIQAERRELLARFRPDG
jgi:PAS domain S-box-containing protein